MNRIKIALLISGIICAGTAQASFTGFGVGVGGSLVDSKMKYDTYNLGLDPRSPSDKDKNGAAFIDLSYGIEVYNDFNIRLGANYTLNEVDSARITLDDPGYTSKLKSKFKNHYSIYVSPGYQMYEDGLLYGKLAYHSAKVEHDGSAISSLSSGVTNKLSNNHRGFGFGAGYSYTFSDNLELDFEIQHIVYQRKSESLGKGSVDIKPTTTEYSMVLRYRF